MLTDKLKQIDRILDKKRSEDFALKFKNSAVRKSSKPKAAAASEKDGVEAGKEGEVGAGCAGQGEEGDGEGVKGKHDTSGARTCFDIMVFLDQKEPGAKFEIRLKGVVLML